MARTKRQVNVLDGAVVLNSAEELRDIVFCLQAEGKTVVFTNGSFDLLHVGHLRCLKDARSRGDYLVVAINTDASVKKYKHPKRPILAEGERVELIAALRCVDYVIKFDDATCDALLAEIKPDVVAKGTDYTPETVPERETIEAFGGRIVICGDAKEHATTKIIQRIRRLKL